MILVSLCLSDSDAQIASPTMRSAFSCFSHSSSLDGLLQLRNVCSQSVAKNPVLLSDDVVARLGMRRCSLPEIRDEEKAKMLDSLLWMRVANACCSLLLRFLQRGSLPSSVSSLICPSLAPAHAAARHITGRSAQRPVTKRHIVSGHSTGSGVDDIACKILKTRVSMEFLPSGVRRRVRAISHQRRAWRALATVLPQDALTHAILIAATLSAGTEDGRAVS